MAPIQVNGRAFAFSYADVIGNKGELATMVSKADWNQVLKERNNGILRIIEKDFEGSFSKLLMDLD